MDILLSHTFEGNFRVRSDFPHCLHVDYIKCSQHANKIFVQDILCHMFSSVSLGQVSGKFPAMDRFFYNTAMSWEGRSACTAGISTKEISLDRTVFVSHSLPSPQAFPRPSEHGIIN